jgi:Family of unknown function (DUF5681)
MGRKRQSNRGEKSASDHAAHVSVGYGQPPLASRFKPGTSGNAKGRPKGSKNFKTLIKQAMTASISIQEGQTSRRVSKIEGVVLRQLQSALKGNERSAMAAIKMAMLVGLLEDNTPAEASAVGAADQQILEQLLTRHRRARRR